ncbi:MAG: hypothetical protein AB1750_08180 [Chloroflexota bacterium]
MLNKISSKFHAWAKGWLVIVMMALDMFFMGFVMPLIGGIMKGGTGLQQPLDLMMFATPDKMFAMIATYGDVSFYRNVELTVDLFIYPPIYTLAFGLLISWLFQRAFKPDSKMMKLNATPVLAWMFDFLENMGIVTMLTMWPGKPVALAWLTMSFTAFKWLFVFATMGLALVGFVMAAMKGFKKQG